MRPKINITCSDCGYPSMRCIGSDELGTKCSCYCHNKKEITYE